MRQIELIRMKKSPVNRPGIIAQIVKNRIKRKAVYGII